MYECSFYYFAVMFSSVVGIICMQFELLSYMSGFLFVLHWGIASKLLTLQIVKTGFSGSTISSASSSFHI